jgi:hypothetical protein
MAYRDPRCHGVAQVPLLLRVGLCRIAPLFGRRELADAGPGPDLLLERYHKALNIS